MSSVSDRGGVWEDSDTELVSDDCRHSGLDMRRESPLDPEYLGM